MFKGISGNLIRRHIKTLSAAAIAASLFVTHSHAGWREDMGVFRIGISTDQGIPYTPQKFELFRKAMSDALSMPVELFQARNASSLIDAVITSRVEYAIMPALAYATADEVCNCLTPLVAAKNQQGADAIKSVLVADASNYKNLDGAKPMRIALGPEYGLTTYILPKAFFALNDTEAQKAAKTYVRVPDHETAMRLFAEGQVDAFFSWQFVSSENEENPDWAPVGNILETSEIKPSVMWSSKPVRFGPHVVRKALPKEAVVALRSTLLNMIANDPLAYDAISPDLAGGFVTVKSEDYAGARSVIRALAALERSLDDIDQSLETEQ